MKTRNMILSGIFALVMLVALNTSVMAYDSGTGIVIPSPVSIYTVKKAALLCDNGASAPPYQDPPEIGGCVDVYDANIRVNEYLFTGEQLGWLVVARDLDSNLALPNTAQLMIDGTQKMECVALTDAQAADLKSGTPWFGHNVAALLTQLPYQQGLFDPTGYNVHWDKIYQCVLTVTPDMVGNPSTLAIQVTDIQQQTATTTTEKWYFNPAISASISFDSGTSILFPPAQQGQTVASANTMLIKNTALGGVDIVPYIVGNDLKDTSMIGMCAGTDGRLTNVLNINKMAYRCKVGTVLSEQFTPIPHIKEAQDCNAFAAKKCQVQDGWQPGNNLLPDAAIPAALGILFNGHTAECTFQLTVPMPCIGTYSASNAVEVLIRAI